LPSRLSNTHIEAQARLRALVAGGVGRAWRNLPGYDEKDVAGFLAVAVPLTTAGQKRSQALTEAYLAAFMGRAPLGVKPAPIRNGTPPEDVYRRPFVTVWTALQTGSMWDDAVNAGLARAESTAAMDMQLASRNTFQAVQEADDGVYGYQRIANAGACEYCSSIDGAYVKSADASPLHPACGCSLEPLTSPHPRASKLPDGTAVHQHGELGAVLGDSAHDFTSASQI
jgi:hypothetical protein